VSASARHGSDATAKTNVLKWRLCPLDAKVPVLQAFYPTLGLPCPMARPIGGRASTSRTSVLISDVDGHGLAGFLDAEGSFSVTEQNAGRTYRCACHVAVRDDDRQILAQFQTRTGLGSLRSIPPRNRSKPQTCWTIASQRDCLRMVELLQTFPLRSRKRHEFAIWAEAVRAWSCGARSHRDVMHAASMDLRAARRYVEPDPSSHGATAKEEPGFLWYLGGFFSGEGSFNLSARKARAVIKLRRDDRPLLEAFAAITGLGRVYDVRDESPANPAALWVIYRQTELADAIELLSSACLRGRKRREFAAWRMGAEEFTVARSERRPRRREIIDVAVESLHHARAYVSPGPLPIRGDRAAAAQRLIGILRQWAAHTTLPLSATRYVRAREKHPDWPTRNTVAKTFGSWAKALEAAGLGGRSATSAEQRERRRKGAAKHRVAVELREARHRAKIAEAVAECARSLGRLPRPMEYFRWRLANAADVPEQTTTYRLFDGEWDAVVATATWWLIDESIVRWPPPRTPNACVAVDPPRPRNGEAPVSASCAASASG
jgi:hypothetical protein